MQEALRQGCRRSARLLQRASSAPGGSHQAVVARSVHDQGDHVAAADGAGRRRRRRADTSKLQDAQQEQLQSRDAGAAAGLEALGSITNRPDVLTAVQAAAGTDAAAQASSPPTKRFRGRPPGAAAAKAKANRDDAAAPSTADAAPADPPEPTAAAKQKAARNVSKKASSKSSSSNNGLSRAKEQQLWSQGYQAVAGVDEAGRGPLAGPVVAAAAVLPPGLEFELLNDSKQMSEADREAVFEQLTTHPEVSYAVALVDHSTIDCINILQATMLAMRTAVEGLAGAGLKPDYLLIDGNRRPPGLDDTPLQVVVKGDASVTCIAAASVIAKVTRDRMMLQLDKEYPQYGFAQHKGYGVPAHKAAIQKHGPCPAHRRSFEPIKSMTSWPGYPKKQGAAAAGTVLAAKARAAMGQ